MSTDITATLIHGFRIPLDRLVKETREPDPLYGKYKYNPDTGELVLPEKVTRTKIDVDAIHRKVTELNVSFEHTYSDSYFLGAMIAKVSTYPIEGLGYSRYHDEANRNMLGQRALDAVYKQAQELGIDMTDIDPGLHLVMDFS